MCGIAGFAGAGNLDDLRGMTETLAHRGPDATAYWHDPGRKVYLGHTRLSILDHAGGGQPMWTEDHRLGIVYNGEIYNGPELRAELEKKGHRFRSDHSDTEVLLHGFREWGAGLPLKLNGMWAFALYDAGRQRILLCRDRFGKKPLYYSQQHGVFAFASESSAFRRHRHLRLSLCHLSLKKYFAYGFIPAPHSWYAEVRKLPAGHSLWYDLDGGPPRVEKYWDFVLEPMDRIPEHPEQQWGEEIRFLLKKAVRRRLLSDVPLGVFLSGGIDSTSVAALAAGLIGPERVRTFSIGFDEPSFDESRFSTAAAAALGVPHALDTFSVNDLPSLAEEVFPRLDEPLGDASILPTYLLCRNSRKHVTVALGGDGADELFAGYDPFRALRPAAWYERLVPSTIHPALCRLTARLPVSHVNMGWSFRADRFIRGMTYPRTIRNAVWLGPLQPNEMQELFREPTPPEQLYSEAIEYWDACGSRNLLDQTLMFFTKLYLQDDILTKVDRASMLNSLEVRSPYLDIDLVDFVRRIPSEYKYRKGQTKYILKSALRPILPRAVLSRAKRGFGIPTGKWLQQGTIRVPDDSGLPLDRSAVRRFVSEHRRGRRNHRVFLWSYQVADRCLRHSRIKV